MAQEFLPGQYERINCPHLEGKSGLSDVAMTVHLDEHHVLMLCLECKMIITGYILKEIVEQAVVPQLKSAIDKAFSRP